jgi:hypothetical protein
VTALTVFDRRTLAAVAAFPRPQPNLIFVTVEDTSRMTAPEDGLRDALLRQLNPHTLLVPHGLSDEKVEGLSARLEALGLFTFIDTYSPTGGELTGGRDEIRVMVWTESTISPRMASALRVSPCAMTVVLIPASLADPDRPDRTWASVLPSLAHDSALRLLSL